MSQETLILIGGPTASGKSALALRLAEARRGVILNADAMQVYRALPILTAQPSDEDKARIPHRLYEIIDPTEPSSAGIWLDRACAEINQTLTQGKTPILVGGTGLYFDALLGGLADIPPIPSEARAAAAKHYAEWGETKFRAELAKHDPESAQKIARNDRQRLIRAYEVVTHTGKALSAWHKTGQDRRALPERAKIEYHLLLPPRDQLYAACDQRFLSMIERGAIDEVKKLLARGLSPTLPSMKILGVREIAAYLRGETSLDEAVAKAQQKTRNYAKRQTTWFRNRWEKTPLFGKDSLNEIPV
ncbi:MAG: tRNA (adenosine(37)-N6)-dimethylallyltransferase MiaA [Alphaproteobacteria bacterium]|nr:tRNA (adenosine(37)-N6)-dimethylallyltransferase MiaA [Alphaproteobacteria bacterium]